MQHEMEEIGSGNKKQYHCRIPLPVDAPNGRQLIADATANRKKDALAQAILEACRLLDAQGALKGTTSIGKRHKGKNWADEDFYDSDEDTFTDRTGTVERKRQQRIQRLGKREQQTAETYESLSARLEAMKEEVQEITEKIQRADRNKAESVGEGGLDDLDRFMDAVKAGLIMDPKTKIKLKQRLAELKQEEVRLIKIINLVKPLDLPAIEPSLWRTTGVVLPDVGSVSRIKAPALPAPAARVYEHSGKSDFVAEEEDDVEEAAGPVEDRVKKSEPFLLNPSTLDETVSTPVTSGVKRRPETDGVVKEDVLDESPVATETDVSRPYVLPVSLNSFSKISFVTFFLLSILNCSFFDFSKWLFFVVIRFRCAGIITIAKWEMVIPFGYTI